MGFVLFLAFSFSTNAQTTINLYDAGVQANYPGYEVALISSFNDTRNSALNGDYAFFSLIPEGGTQQEQLVSHIAHIYVDEASNYSVEIITPEPCTETHVDKNGNPQGDMINVGGSWLSFQKFCHEELDRNVLRPTGTHSKYFYNFFLQKDIVRIGTQSTFDKGFFRYPVNFDAAGFTRTMQRIAQEQNSRREANKK